MYISVLEILCISSYKRPTFPVSDISPVMASRGRIGTPEARLHNITHILYIYISTYTYILYDIHIYTLYLMSAVAMAMPAEGPSFSTAPSGQ